MNTIEKKDIFGISINVLKYEDVLNFYLDSLRNAETPKTIYFLNAHCYNIAQKNKQYKDSLNQADLLLNDGIGVKIASKLAGINFQSNMNGTDLIPFLLEETAKLPFKVYLIGAKEGYAEDAKSRLLSEHQDLNIIGCNSGYFKDRADEERVIAEINRLETDVLVVGMGVPIQELWIHENKSKLSKVKIILAGGAIIDRLSGRLKRAPRWVRAIEMEWLYRLIQEPKRLAKRYLIGNFVFCYSILLKYFRLSK